ncbi:MAG: Na(+)-translocating NADH-quinone reductase subunit A [Nannocystaceae bacterium]
MALHSIKKGLDLPIAGTPQQRIEDGAEVSQVAVVAADFAGLKPGMAVGVGDEVKRGQCLFIDRKSEGVVHTAPGAGRVVAVNRGRYRVLQTVVIELSPTERAGQPAEEEFLPFPSYSGKPVGQLSGTEVRDLLVESGLWTALRARPFGRVPSPTSEAPHSIFVTASETNPLGADVDQVLAGCESDFETGLIAVSKLSGGKTYLCKTAGSKVSAGSADVCVEAFSGPHPAGTVGLHIHTLDPVRRGKTVWHLHYQDLISIGRLVKCGKLEVDRVVALAGPTVRKPRLIRTRVGANVHQLVAGELEAGENRVVSGSVLSGRSVTSEVDGFLGRYHLQICALAEGRKREFLGWMKPGVNAFSATGIYVSQLSPGRTFRLNTTTHGSRRAMVPIGAYERIFPFDILPTFLLRSLLMGDVTRAEALGALELDEEDVALCTFVCPGKQDYGAALRKNLDEIWSDG